MSNLLRLSDASDKFAVGDCILETVFRECLDGELLHLYLCKDLYRVYPDKHNISSKTPFTLFIFRYSACLGQINHFFKKI